MGAYRAYYPNMSETQSKYLGADVVKNEPLQYMYILGGMAAGIGLLIAIIASFNMSSYNGVSGAALAWQAIGGLMAGAGVLALIGAGVAHAINWQIVNR
jgi:hypothetical protein